MRWARRSVSFAKCCRDALTESSPRRRNRLAGLDCFPLEDMKVEEIYKICSCLVATSLRELFAATPPLDRVGTVSVRKELMREVMRL